MSASVTPHEPKPIVDGLFAHCPRCGARLLTAHASCPGCGVDPTSEEAHARLLRKWSPQGEFLRGVAYLPRGAAAILRRPHVWPVIAVPLLLNVVFAVGVAFVVVPPLANWLSWVTSPNALADWTGWLKPFRLALVFLGWTVRGAPFFAVPGLTAWVLSTPPFRVFFAAAGVVISDRFERDLLGLGRGEKLDELQRGRSVAAAILSSIGLMAFECALYLVLLPVALVPFVGSFVWLVTPRLLVVALDQTDPVLVRKLYYPREKAALWWRHRWRFFGFGLAVLALLGAPFFCAFVLALAPVAAALLYVELDPK
jgi:uncharacterized protein involved in cysteine biosynthesis